jgi:CDP-glucose 4,6-dehydratase
VSAYLALGAALLDGLEGGEAFNFGNDAPVAVLDLVDEIIRAVGSPELAPVIQSDAPNEIPAQWLDSTKARTRLGWTPVFSLPDGLERTVAWYREALA